MIGAALGALLLVLIPAALIDDTISPQWNLSCKIGLGNEPSIQVEAAAYIRNNIAGEPALVKGDNFRYFVGKSIDNTAYYHRMKESPTISESFDSSDIVWKQYDWFGKYIFLSWEQGYRYEFFFIGSAPDQFFCRECGRRGYSIGLTVSRLGIYAILPLNNFVNYCSHQEYVLCGRFTYICDSYRDAHTNRSNIVASVHMNNFQWSDIRNLSSEPWALISFHNTQLALHDRQLAPKDDVLRYTDANGNGRQNSNSPRSSRAESDQPELYPQALK
jgi:hypothetical protein